jgi:hypothetical protein
MYKIIASHNYNYDELNNKYVRQCDIMCDTSTDLPSETDISKYNIGFGTIAYVIDSGEYYVLNSSGVWS